MADKNTFISDLLGITDPSNHQLYICGFPDITADENTTDQPATPGAVFLYVPLYPFDITDGGRITESKTDEVPHGSIAIRAYGPDILRITVAPTPMLRAAQPPVSPMLDFASDVVETTLNTRIGRNEYLNDDTSLSIYDGSGTERISFRKNLPVTTPWSTLLPGANAFLDAAIGLSDGSSLHIDGFDQFFPAWRQSVGLGFSAENGEINKVTCSFHANLDERFCGSGERFAPIDLSGRTLRLVNEDALGVNSSRAYKNVPFFMSSRGYAVFAHTSFPVTASFKGTSSRAMSLAVDTGILDLFILSAGSPEGLLNDYRRLTGFPPELPRWSYGTWMSRMTYFSADEIEEITKRLRDESYPCDLIHIDTGWFQKDWVCEWRFSDERFPDPAGFMKRLKNDGFRVSLWQNPNLGNENRLLPEALEKGYVPKPPGYVNASASDFAAAGTSGQIDFSNPDAVAWYRSLLRELFDAGTSVIKTDFGEELRDDVSYHAMSADELRNLYGLLYQRAAFEETAAATGEPMVWARAGWAGCQRYPVHWGGDAAATWDGLAASLRGGLHLGLSGFGYWSHDVPGFHGIPDFMNTRPEPLLYLRWTQFGVLSSHLRYHGTFPREPWHFPEVSDIVREWLELRYALIPYLEREAHTVATSGFPMLRALILHHPGDRQCWAIDDEYYLGADILVAPVLSPSGIRDVYLPEGIWVDFITGATLEGNRWLSAVESTESRIPLYVRLGASIPIYPKPVQHTDEMNSEEIIEIHFDDTYRGLVGTPLGAFIEL